MKCNIRCWECKQNCNIKLAMYLLPENFFYSLIMEDIKSYAGFNQVMNGWTNEKAKDFVMKQSVAFYVARQKVLNTPKK